MLGVIVRLSPTVTVQVATSPPATLAFAGRLLPVVQALQALDRDTGVPMAWDAPLWSLGEMALVTALGLALFRRKDIK